MIHHHMTGILQTDRWRACLSICVSDSLSDSPIADLKSLLHQRVLSGVQHGTSRHQGARRRLREQGSGGCCLEDRKNRVIGIDGGQWTG